MAAFLISCNKDKTTTSACDRYNPTYSRFAKSMIQNNCTSGGRRPSYSTYSGVKHILQNAAFKSQVITSQNMSRGRNLSQTELSHFQCSADNGFLE